MLSATGQAQSTPTKGFHQAGLKSETVNMCEVAGLLNCAIIPWAGVTPPGLF